MSFLVALTLKQSIGGVVGFSGVILPMILSAQESSFPEHAKTLPVLHYHGDKDVLFKIAETEAQAKEFWAGFKGFRFEREEGLGHRMSRRGIEYGSRFIEECLVSSCN